MSLTTDGSGTDIRSARKNRSVVWTSSALVSKTRRTARREETIPNGSNVALRTRARLGCTRGEHVVPPLDVDVLAAFAFLGRLDRRSIRPEFSPVRRRACDSSASPPESVAFGRSAPLQIGHDVLDVGLCVGPAVGGDHPERPQVLVGEGKVGGTPPPPRLGQPPDR